MITDPGDFFQDGCGRCDRFASDSCPARIWAGGLAVLRDACRDAGLVETAKWGHLCYLHAGRNIAILAAIRGDLRLTFFNASLLEDRGGLLARQGAKSAIWVRPLYRCCARCPGSGCAARPDRPSQDPCRSRIETGQG